MARPLILALCLIACALGAAADTLPDPTRPPNFTAGDSLPEGGMVLQSVLISPARRIAIIGGQAVAVGDRIGEAQVVAINEQEVTIREGKDTRTLRMFTGIEKAQSAPGAKTGDTGAKKGSKK